jgi:acetoin utilization deacetylase AcuC-like enzyme
MIRPFDRLPTVFVTDPGSAAHLSPGHPERPDRLEAIVAQLERTGLRARMLDLPARDATDEEILAVHRAELLQTEAEAARSGAWLDPDTYACAETPAIARRAAGAAMTALDAVLAGEARNAFVAARPPGHHATTEQAMGFCHLNNVAIAAQAALDRGIERVAILDWDVHHGNGTQAIFDAEPHLFFASTHAYPLYPGTGHHTDAGTGLARGTKVNVPLPPGAGDIALTSAYSELILPAMERFAPELVLVSCGWDAHARDPLAPLEVSTAGYTHVARLAIAAADRACDGRLIAILEGGYDTHALAWCASALCELLLGDEPMPDPEPVPAGFEPDVTPVLDAVREVLAHP